MPYSFLATAAFGLEGIVSNELKRLGYSAKAEQGCARFTGELADGFRANLCLRTADRVLLLLDEKPVLSFEELFQFVSSLPWENYLDRSSRIHVSGKCVRSQLMSVRDCQSIVKKAIVERLKKRLRVDRLPETGPRVPIEIALYRDQARLTIDMSGDALNRRGYRPFTKSPQQCTHADQRHCLCQRHCQYLEQEPSSRTPHGKYRRCIHLKTGKERK